ncbi:hypothetical protein F5146DRAFT_924422, partial [Armillaria mellea]
YKKVIESESTADMKTYFYYYAQIEGEQTRNKLYTNPKKRRAQMMMDHFPCHGWMYVQVSETDLTVVNMCLSHHCVHTPYCDISIDGQVKTILDEMSDMPAHKVKIFTLL